MLFCTVTFRIYNKRNKHASIFVCRFQTPYKIMFIFYNASNFNKTDALFRPSEKKTVEYYFKII